MQASVSDHKAPKYHVYEGTAYSRDNSFAFSRKDQALRYIKDLIALKEYMAIPYIAHLIVSKTGEFVHTASTYDYEQHEAKVTAEIVAASKARQAQEVAHIWGSSEGRVAQYVNGRYAAYNMWGVNLGVFDTQDQAWAKIQKSNQSEPTMADGTPV